MAAVAPAQGIQPGALSPAKIHELVTAELNKVKQIGDQLGGQSISKLPDKAQRKRLEVEAGSVFNISGKNAQLIEISNQITQALKTAGKTITKSLKVVFEAKAKLLKAIGEIEVAIASGKSSLDAAFKKRADLIIQQSLIIAEKGGLDDKNTALENIQLLEQFQNVPSVAMALAKNGVKITNLKTETSAPALLPFLAKAAGGGSNPADLAKKYGSNPADALAGASGKAA